MNNLAYKFTTTFRLLVLDLPINLPDQYTTDSHMHFLTWDPCVSFLFFILLSSLKILSMIIFFQLKICLSKLFNNIQYFWSDVSPSNQSVNKSFLYTGYLKKRHCTVCDQILHTSYQISTIAMIATAPQTTPMDMYNITSRPTTETRE